jgi:hypothetical protein
MKDMKEVMRLPRFLRSLAMTKEMDSRFRLPVRACAVPVPCLPVRVRTQTGKYSRQAGITDEN